MLVSDTCQKENIATVPRSIIAECVGLVIEAINGKIKVKTTSLFDRKKSKLLMSYDELDDSLKKSIPILVVGDIIYINSSNIPYKIGNIKSNDTTLLLTENCNQNCVMCAQAHNQKQKDTILHEISEIVTEIYLKHKSKVIGISGGEPTLCIKQINKLLNRISKEKKYPSVEILTNATLFANEENVQKIEKIEGISFHIPLYSDSERIHNDIVQRKHFYKAVKGIYNLDKYHYSIEIRNVVMKSNFQRLSKWAEFISHNFPFVFHVAIMGLEPIGNAITNIKDTWIEPAETIDEVSKAITIFDRAMINVSIYNYPLCVIPTDLHDYYASSISDWKQIYLPQCEGCQKKGICCGVFSSQKIYHSKYINPIIGVGDEGI